MDKRTEEFMRKDIELYQKNQMLEESKKISESLKTAKANKRIRMGGVRMSQKEKVLNHLQKHGTIDTWTCFKKYRITRLSQYILLLRNEGFNITDEWVKPKQGNRFKRYFYTKKELSH